VNNSKSICCPICGNCEGLDTLSQWDPVAQGVKGAEAGIYNMICCPECFGGFSDPMKPSNYSEVFSDISHLDYANSLRSSLRRNYYYSAFLTFLNNIESKGNLLDIGMGLGVWLGLARRIGFVPHGTDINEETVSFVNNNAPEINAAFVSENDGMPPEWPQKFDVVTCFDVIEHVADPPDLLDYLLGLVKPGGLLLMRIPNRDRYSFKLGGIVDDFLSRETPDMPPYHLTHWRERTVRVFLRNAGVNNYHIVKGGLLWRKNIMIKGRRSSILSGFMNMLYKLSAVAPFAAVKKFESLGTHLLIYIVMGDKKTFDIEIGVKRSLRSVYQRDIPFFEEVEVK